MTANSNSAPTTTESATATVSVVEHRGNRISTRNSTCISTRNRISIYISNCDSTYISNPNATAQLPSWLLCAEGSVETHDSDGMNRDTDEDDDTTEDH